MRIGILTFHDGPNHGAFFQAFGTMKYLQSIGHDVEVINYKNQIHKKMESPWRIMKFRHPRSGVDFVQKDRAIRKDRGFFNQTVFTTSAADVLKLKYDAVIIGSDIVWNYKLFGYDDLYFGGVNADKKIAYAPSFGWVKHGEPLPEAVVNGLRRFRSISVRDHNSQQIVASVLGSEPPLVVDPTFLYDFSPFERVTDRIEKQNRFLLVYAFQLRPDEVIEIQRYARERELSTVALGYRQKWCDVNLMDVGAFEWLGFYRHCAGVVSSTFHGTIFAIKYNKPFVVSMNSKVEHKVRSLLETCGLSDQATEGAKVSDKLDCPIDYRKVNDMLSLRINSSKEWLASALAAG